MAKLRLALAQLDFPVGAVAANAARMARADRAGARRRRRAGRVSRNWPFAAIRRKTCCCDRASSPPARASSPRWPPATQGIVALVGHPHSEGEVYNAASVLREGAWNARAHKQALPNYGVFDDKRYFRPGHETVTPSIEGVRVGLLICEDVWQPEPAAQAARGRRRAAAGDQRLAVGRAPSRREREALLVARARETGCAIAYVNLVGGQDEVVFDGGSLLVERRRHDRRARAGLRRCAAVGRVRSGHAHAARATTGRWPPTARSRRRCTPRWCAASATTSTRTAFRGVLLGLSGGIDSALTLALAVDALGAERVTAVMMPTRYTSQLSLDGARAQAEQLGVDYHVIADRARRSSRSWPRWRRHSPASAPTPPRKTCSRASAA